jgi:hypothetical protein
MKFACGIWFALMALVQAGLDFPSTLKEIHAPADAKIVTAEFEFTNRTEKSITVAKVNPTCSCIAVKIKNGKLQYAPGESGLIRAEFDMGNFSGTVDKVVAIWLDNDADDQPSLALTVRVHIPVLISLEPKSVKWSIGGKAEPQTIRITMNHTSPIRVIDAKSSSEDFKLEMKAIEEGKIYDLIVTPVDLTSAGLAVLRIETDCALAKYRTQQAFGIIRKPSPAEAKP